MKKLIFFHSTRISNELGAGNPNAVQAAVVAAMILAVVEAISVSTILFCCRSVLGFAFSSEKEVVDYVAEIAPLLSLSVIMDSLLVVLSGLYIVAFTFLTIYVVMIL